MAMAEELPTPPALPSTDAEGRGALPAPEPERRDLASDGAKWLTAAALVLAVAGGYWAFAQNHQGKLEQARALSEAKRQTPDREAKPAAEQRPAQAPQHGAEAGRASAQTARRDTQAAAERAETARKRIEPAVQTAAVPDAPPRSLANAPAAAAGVADGLYAGPICYGPAAAEPPRCFRAQATLSRGRIAGQWPGRDPGVTMVMAGEVSASGEAKMRVHAEKRDGTRAAAIDLTGTLKEGRSTPPAVSATAAPPPSTGARARRDRGESACFSPDPRLSPPTGWEPTICCDVPPRSDCSRPCW